MEFFKDLWLFVKERKKWWLIPFLVIIILLAFLIAIGSSSALAPFIYSLF
jgi:hypothetical protein